MESEDIAAIGRGTALNPVGGIVGMADNKDFIGHVNGSAGSIELKRVTLVGGRGGSGAAVSFGGVFVDVDTTLDFDGTGGATNEGSAPVGGGKVVEGSGIVDIGTAKIDDAVGHAFGCLFKADVQSERAGQVS